ncbi:sodium:solute symporter [Euzebya sp.]|uniref:sodium:solute symporter n=1 Tax=Euzebya sp. TaxID=1971409 RepID=UPI00351235DC
MEANLAALDWAIIGLYFVGVFGVAVWAYRSEASKDTAAGYFLGGRNIGWFVVGASLFVSNIGSEHLVGLSGTGADSGVATAQFELLASLILLLLGWVFVPFYVKSGVFTMPEFLEKRYSPGARRYLSYISIVGYVLTKITVSLYAGGIVFETLMGVSFWTGAIVTVLFTGLYTVIGGLRAVVYTDMLQMFVLIIGSVLVTVLGLAELGGWGVMTETVPEGFMSVWQPLGESDFPWTGILLGAPITGIWYWCTDQYIVQRTLAARNIDNARRGTIFGGYLKLLPLFIFVIPGLIAYALTQTGALELESSDQALPALVGAILPAGIRGIVVAGLLAALMSSLSSVFNATSTLVTWDVYREWKPDASEGQLVWVGRASTAALTVVGLAFIPLMENISNTLYAYLQSVQSYIAPPIAAVFILGLAWKRINAKGALASLWAGFVVGFGRLALELYNGAENDRLPSGSWLEAFAEFNFLHFAFVLFLFCVMVLVGVSAVTQEPATEDVEGLTYGTAEAGTGSAGRHGGGGTATETETETEADVDLTDDPAWRRRDLLLSGGVIAGVVACWIYFSPLVF